ncbi:uncharacterized protein I303_106842 [Kwoniella dejecticola CBS 10117]|uniref:Uncharacterized protein n=1 Tax=Kwoniella dejecticola CBS 10117 TaxID=1296121 RepID=A0AAJ8KUY2_9TREE
MSADVQYVSRKVASDNWDWRENEDHEETNMKTSTKTEVRTDPKTQTETQTLDTLLCQYRAALSKRNDPIIHEAKRLLWVIQGESELSKLIRRLIFPVLDLKERLSGRDRLEKRLKEAIERS